MLGKLFQFISLYDFVNSFLRVCLVVGKRKRMCLVAGNKEENKRKREFRILCFYCKIQEPYETGNIVSKGISDRERETRTSITSDFSADFAGLGHILFSTLVDSGIRKAQVKVNLLCW